MCTFVVCISVCKNRFTHETAAPNKGKHEILCKAQFAKIKTIFRDIIHHNLESLTCDPGISYTYCINIYLENPSE